VKKTLFGISAVAVASVSMAHHSGAMFDRTRTVTLEGTVKEFQFTNPHSWLQVMVKGADGKEVEWGFENEGPSSLKRMGIEATTFKAGDKVTVVASPMKDGRPAGAWMSIKKADGKSYGRGGGGGPPGATPQNFRGPAQGASPPDAPKAP
jgi:hypothetical protein